MDGSAALRKKKDLGVPEQPRLYGVAVRHRSFDIHAPEVLITQFKLPEKKHNLLKSITCYQHY